MTATTTMILFLLVLKHPIADIYLQTYHSNIRFALAIAALEYVLHWHIDWSKTSIAKFLNYARQDDKFWRLHTLDQLLHFITYGFIVCLYSKYAF